MTRHDWKEKWESTKHFGRFLLSVLFGDFITWLVIAVVILVWVARLPNIDFRDFQQLTFWVIVSLSVPTFVGLLRYFSEYDDTLQKVHGSGLILFEKFLSSLPDLSQHRLLRQKLSVIKTTFDKLPADFGGIVIGADEKEYVERLNELIPLTHDSFYATLRGGYQPLYTIGWFFEDSSEGAPPLRKAKKLAYLRNVNKANISIKKRIIILRQDEMDNFRTDSWRNQFFNLNTKLKVYLIDPDDLIKKLVENYSITRGEANFVWDDYAVFDKCIVVKHNGKNSLYLGVANQIRKMLLPFDLLNARPELFKKLDANGISEYKGGKWKSSSPWDRWKRL